MFDRWRNDGSTDDETTFEPVATDGNRILGIVDDGEERRLAWLSTTVADTVDPEEIDEFR